MILSQRTQYAVRAILELAKHEGAGPVKAARIAAAQHIPARFLDNILSQLRQAGIVQAQRGKEGGYRLDRPAREVSVGEIIRLVQGPVSVIECAGDAPGSTCPFRPGCVLLPLWEEAHKAMMDVYDDATFADLVEQERTNAGCEVIDYAI